MNPRTSTTVKIENTLYNEFKFLGVTHKVTLQNIVERCIYRYVKDEEFRNITNNFILPMIPESPPMEKTEVKDNSILPIIPEILTPEPSSPEISEISSSAIIT